MNKGELTRQRIIKEAAPIFNQKGFDGCSIQDLMEATGLEKGGIYRHFESKEQLAVAAFHYALHASVKMRTDNLSHIEGSVAKLMQVVQRFVDTPSAVAGGCPLMNTAVDADDGNPVLRTLARDGILAWKKRLASIVEGGIRGGEIQKETDPRQIANAIVGTLEGALMISRMERTRSALLDAQKTLKTILEGIRAKG